MLFFVFLSSSQHTVNLGISSPTFTDASLRYASVRDGISASVSFPSAGFLGLQVNSGVPSQMSARVYSRYPVSIFYVIKIIIKDDFKINILNCGENEYVWNYFFLINSLPQTWMSTCWP